MEVELTDYGLHASVYIINNKTHNIENNKNYKRINNCFIINYLLSINITNYTMILFLNLLFFQFYCVRGKNHLRCMGYVNKFFLYNFLLNLLYFLINSIKYSHRYMNIKTILILSIEFIFHMLFRQVQKLSILY